MYTDYRMNDENIQAYQIHERIIKTIKSRFQTYGYKQMRTSSFEQYDLYSHVSSSINRNEMIKVIDHTGEVLVLRPDVTIPITHQLAQNMTELSDELRYFYVQDVFRQSFDRGESIENTQAGIEYFGDRSPEADAEVIALACQTLQDLGFRDIKIEMGHAGFFQDLIADIQLTKNDLEQLKNFIQAKNRIDIVPFLQNLAVDPDLIDAISEIPFLYGNPAEVGERAKAITLTKDMQGKLAHLLKIYDILKMYGMEQYVIMDLGLINQMGYYSDVIFQGFVEKFGQPMLMGGRYDHLGDAFGASIPAIGFACTVDSIVEALNQEAHHQQVLLDVKLVYTPEQMAEAIQLTNGLRAEQYSVISYPYHKKVTHNESHFTIDLKAGDQTIHYQNKTLQFSSLEELLKIMKGDI